MNRVGTIPCILLLAACARGADRYLDASATNAVEPYLTWATAASNVHQVHSVLASGDTLWVAPGVYVLTNTFRLINTVTIRGTGGPGLTVWTRNPSGAKFRILESYGLLTGCSLAVHGLTIENGFEARDGLGGGGILIIGGQFSGESLISNCVIRGNTAPAWPPSNAGCGGGLRVYGARATIADTLVCDNLALRGGGIHVEGTVTMTDCCISNNWAFLADDPAGGFNGGGIALADSSGTAALRNCAICHNYAYGLGGGVYSRALSVTLVNCMIVGNRVSTGSVTAGDGGGLHLDFSGQAQHYELQHCTIAANSAPRRGGGVYMTIPYPTLTSCIVWSNNAPEWPEWYYPAQSTPTYRFYRCALSPDPTNACTAPEWYPMIGTWQCRTDNPLMEGYWELSSNSWCIDYCPTGPTDDFYHVARPFGSGFDVGAVESLPADADWDADGMPTAWEKAYGLNPRRAQDAAEDTDGDGAGTYAEYIADTNPRDALSVLAIRGMAKQPSGLVLRFHTSAAREYAVDCAPAGGAWTCWLDNIRTTGGLHSVVHTNFPLPCGFYRLRARLP